MKFFRRANSYSTNSIVYISNNVFINVECPYSTYVDDISATDTQTIQIPIFANLVLVRVVRVSLISVVQTITALGGSTDKDGEDGEFHFNLEMFIDEEMDFPVDNDHTTSIGDTLFFKLSQKHPVNGLIFSIDGITYLI